MNIAAIVALAKERLGIKTNVRDTYLTAIVNGIVTELTDEKGIILDESNPYHLMFVVDYACWRYQSRDSSGAMPRDLQFRMHNLMVHSSAPVEGVTP
jgi:hypothetical protein